MEEIEENLSDEEKSFANTAELVNPRLSSQQVIEEKPSEEAFESKLEEEKVNSQRETDRMYPEITPEELLESMVRSFKTKKSVPQEAVSNLKPETLQTVVEKLLQEKINLQEQLGYQESNKHSMFFSEEDFSRHFNEQSKRKLKIQALREFGNVSPIEKEENFVQFKASSPKSTLREDLINIKYKKYANYEAELIKLNQELQEIRTYNQMLEEVFQHQKNNTHQTLTQKMQKRLQSYQEVLNTIQESISLSKKSLASKESLVIGKRSELKLLWEVSEMDKEFRVKPSERQIITDLLELNCKGPQFKFDEHVCQLLARYDIGELAGLITKYILYLEDELCVELRKHLFESRVKEMNQNNLIQNCIEEKAYLCSKLESLKNKLTSMHHEETTQKAKQQVQIRKKPSILCKKWQVPKECQELSPKQLYSLSIKR